MNENERKTESGLSLYHPVVSFGYFAAVLVGTLLFVHPVFGLLSLVSAIICSAFINGKKVLLTTLGFGIPTFLFIALANPLFNHHGATFLFYLRDNPVTMESLLYGLVSGAMMFAAVVWFTCYNTVVTSDKFLYIFGRALPSAALIVSMTLSLIPRLFTQLKVITESQRTLGLDWKSGTVRERFRAGNRILSILVSWALEDAVTTADSMRSRGYGNHKRSSFSIFRFGRRDGILLAVILLLTVIEITAWFSGRGTLEFYPVTVWKTPDALDYFLYGAFFLLGILPSIITWKEDLKWKRLKSNT